MTNSLNNYRSVWVIDTEFQQPDGEPNLPVCLCAEELHSGRRLEFFFDQHHKNPFDYENSLFVCYHAAAEWKTFIALGWDLPPNVLDLYFEYLNRINGVWRGGQCLRKVGSGLVDALAEFGEDALSHEEKGEERQYIIKWGVSPPPSVSLQAHQQRILNYCWTDVDGARKLLPRMFPDIDMEQALLRGDYSKPVAWIEHNGLPISPLYHEIQKHRNELQVHIAREVEAKYGYGVFAIEGKKKERAVFKQKGFDMLVERSGYGKFWPTTPNRLHYSTNDEEAFGPMCKLHPELEPLRQARKSIKALSLIGTILGKDNRNRAAVWPFGTVSGRNNPKAKQFILSRPHWVRNLIAPTEGRAIVHADIIAAEAGIAADLSGDPELIRIYQSGADQYLEFAKSAGVVPRDAVRDKKNAERELIRDLYKVALLGIQYGIGADTLSQNLGIPLWQAERIIASHKRTYPTYWAWVDAQIRRARQQGYISTDFGWKLEVGPDTPHNTLLNFPQQAGCAEILRLACVLAEERGLGPMLCAPHHDALYLECDDANAEQVAAELEACFRDASDTVLGGRVQLRLETGIVRHPDHYCDDDGQEIWQMVAEFLGRKQLDAEVGHRELSISKAVVHCE
jgi:DNA polymerase I